MCYSATHMTEKVGIRKLRQNLSRYVARTVRGESFDVTDRGQSPSAGSCRPLRL